MAGTDTFIFRAALHGARRSIETSRSILKNRYTCWPKPSFPRSISITPSAFTPGLRRPKSSRNFPNTSYSRIWASADPRVLGVKKTKISQAFSDVRAYACYFCSITAMGGISGLPCVQSGRRARRPGIRAWSPPAAKLLRSTRTLMMRKTSGDRGRNAILLYRKQYVKPCYRPRHCEERLVRRSSRSVGGSNEAIQGPARDFWIASLRSQ